MKVEFADSFGKSLKRLMWHESRIYKFYSIFRYGIPRFITNIWRFKKILWTHQWWDYRYHLELMHTSLSLMEKNVRKYGYEIDESRNKKTSKMRRAIELMENKINDNYIDRAELVLGDLILHDWEFEDVEDKPGCSRLIDNEKPEEKEYNKKIYDYAQDLEQEEWDELWKIYRGQDPYIKTIGNESHYDDYFDGSGLNTWWD